MMKMTPKLERALIALCNADAKADLHMYVGGSARTNVARAEAVIFRSTCAERRDVVEKIIRILRKADRNETDDPKAAR